MATPTDAKRQTLVTYLKLFATAASWGGAFVAGRFIAGHIEPSSAGFIRFTSASLLLALVLLRRD